MGFKKFYILLPFLLIAMHGSSQTEKPVFFKNIIHAEAGGIGGYGSLNYERVFQLPGLFTISGRLGISTIRIYDFTQTFNPDLLFPIAVNGFYGKDHKIHLGFGQLVNSSIRANHLDGTAKRETSLHTHFTFGYRYQKTNGRLILGISYTPIIEFQETYRHWGALTVGFAF